MKALWLSTSSMGLQPIIESFEYSMKQIMFTSVSSMNLEPIVSGLQKIIDRNFKFHLYKFDSGKEEQHHYPGEVDRRIIDKFEEIKPDLVIYSGPAEGRCRPDIETFKKMRKSAKVMNLVCDGGCPNWHPILEEYKTEQVFDLTVNIDGNHDWPKSKQDLTFWGLIDPTYYDKQGIAKTTRLGFAGGCGSAERRVITEYLKDKCQLDIPKRSEQWGTYQSYADYMLGCKMIVNMSKTGSGKTHHLKYRVIESGFASCCLFEEMNPITKRYFTPGWDYIEYMNKEHLVELINKITEEEIRGYATALNKTVNNLYAPGRAWEQVLKVLDISVHGI